MTIMPFSVLTVNSGKVRSISLLLSDGSIIKRKRCTCNLEFKGKALREFLAAAAIGIPLILVVLVVEFL